METLSSQPTQRMASVWKARLLSATPHASQGRARTSAGSCSPRARICPCNRSTAIAAAAKAILLSALSGSPRRPGATRSQYRSTGSDHAMSEGGSVRRLAESDRLVADPAPGHRRHRLGVPVDLPVLLAAERPEHQPLADHAVVDGLLA